MEVLHPDMIPWLLTRLGVESISPETQAFLEEEVIYTGYDPREPPLADGDVNGENLLDAVRRQRRREAAARARHLKPIYKSLKEELGEEEAKRIFVKTERVEGGDSGGRARREWKEVDARSELTPFELECAEATAAYFETMLATLVQVRGFRQRTLGEPAAVLPDAEADRFLRNHAVRVLSREDLDWLQGRVVWPMAEAWRLANWSSYELTAEEAEVVLREMPNGDRLEDWRDLRLSAHVECPFEVKREPGADELPGVTDGGTRARHFLLKSIYWEPDVPKYECFVAELELPGDGSGGPPFGGAPLRVSKMVIGPRGSGSHAIPLRAVAPVADGSRDAAGWRMLRGSVGDELRSLSVVLQERIPWRHADIAAYVLTGRLENLRSLKVDTYIPHADIPVLPDGNGHAEAAAYWVDCLTGGQAGMGERNIQGLITISALPWVSTETVAKAHAAAHRTLLTPDEAYATVDSGVSDAPTAAGSGDPSREAARNRKRRVRPPLAGTIRQAAKLWRFYKDLDTAEVPSMREAHGKVVRGDAPSFFRAYRRACRFLSLPTDAARLLRELRKKR